MLLLGPVRAGVPGRSRRTSGRAAAATGAGLAVPPAVPRRAAANGSGRGVKAGMLWGHGQRAAATGSVLVAHVGVARFPAGRSFIGRRKTP
jgi:hypothetical protein